MDQQQAFDKWAASRGAKTTEETCYLGQINRFKVPAIFIEAFDHGFLASRFCTWGPQNHRDGIEYVLVGEPYWSREQFEVFVKEAYMIGILATRLRVHFHGPGVLTFVAALMENHPKGWEYFSRMAGSRLKLDEARYLLPRDCDPTVRLNADLG